MSTVSILNDILIQFGIQAVYTKAKKHELAGEYDRAFEAYLKAASLFLHLNRTSPNEKHKLNAQTALDRAEKLRTLRSNSRTIAVDWFSNGTSSLHPVKVSATLIP